MRIKKEFLNAKSLKPYGFKEEILYGDSKYREYKREDEYVTTLIQILHGDISIVMHLDDCDSDTVDVPDVVYRLIKDGLVEADEPEKMTLAQVCKLLGREIEIVE